jgi:hypothetical protein
MRLEDAADAGMGIEIALQRLTPGSAALVDQGRIERVGAFVDPLPQMLAVGLREGRFQLLAVFQRDDAPAHHLEQLVDALEQPVADDGVQALAVVVDDPPQIAHVVLPAFEQGLEDVALVELGVAHQRHHAALLLRRHQRLQRHIVLHQGGEQGHCRAKTDRAGREIDVVLVLGARGIGLRAVQLAEILQPLLRLVAEQILNRVEHWRGVRLDRDSVLRPQHGEIERGHDGGKRRARRLMAADLQAVAAFALVIGVVNHPRRQPQDLLLQRLEAGQFRHGGRLDRGGFLRSFRLRTGHRRLLECSLCLTQFRQKTFAFLRHFRLYWHSYSKLSGILE